jgi:hypothetical protein
LAQVQTIQRSQGRSVVAAAAYRSGASLTDERLAMEFDFAGKDRDVRARNDTARRDRRDYSDTADRIEAAAPKVEAPIDKLVVEATRVRAELIADRDAWSRERDALKSTAVPTSRQIERELLAEDRTARARARARLQQTETRIKRTREQRNELLAWIRNPARMIYAKHAELNALARARAEVRRADLKYAFRQTWLRSAPGQAAIANRRQPDLDRAAQAAGKRRTLERKIKRMDKRIASATRTLNDLIVAQELGARSLKVPAQSPDATRFIRSVGEPARAAIARHPVPARTQAIDRLNKGQGRRIARTLFPTL